MSPTGDFLPIAAESHQRMPLETLGFKTSSFVYKSCTLKLAEAGNWSASTHAAATLPVEEACCSIGENGLPQPL